MRDQIIGLKNAHEAVRVVAIAAEQEPNYSQDQEFANAARDLCIRFCEEAGMEQDDIMFQPDQGGNNNNNGGVDRFVNQRRNCVYRFLDPESDEYVGEEEVGFLEAVFQDFERSGADNNLLEDYLQDFLEDFSDPAVNIFYDIDEKLGKPVREQEQQPAANPALHGHQQLMGHNPQNQI